MGVCNADADMVVCVTEMPCQLQPDNTPHSSCLETLVNLDE